MKPEYRQMAPGGLVRIEGDEGMRFGTFMFNPHSLIAARLLDRDPAAQIDVDWLRTRLREAIALRERVCDTAFHRLVHAEADRLPGLVIDRYDDVAVLQANTAGMDRLTPLIVEALIGIVAVALGGGTQRLGGADDAEPAAGCGIEGESALDNVVNPAGCLAKRPYRRCSRAVLPRARRGSRLSAGQEYRTSLPCETTRTK